MIDTTGKTLQEVSDEIAAKLIEQGERSVRATHLGANRCAYSDGEGRHCAIGWLLNPRNGGAMSFVGGVGGLRFGGFLSREPAESFINEHMGTLRIIQALHDNTTKVGRQREVGRLSSRGIDTKAWKPWVALGKKESQVYL
jgi:hypothetical protein